MRFPDQELCLLEMQTLKPQVTGMHIKVQAYSTAHCTHLTSPASLTLILSLSYFLTET